MKACVQKVIAMVIVLVIIVLPLRDFTDLDIYAVENNFITIHFKSEWSGANIFYWNQDGTWNRPNNFSEVDSMYESDGVTYQTLIDEVHKRGMKIIQDIVFNHTCNCGEENLLKIMNPVYTGGRSEMVTANGIKDDPENIYHHKGFCGGGDWDGYSAQVMTISDDCFDLNTENPKVYKYLIKCYENYIKMVVDVFRIDTARYISRLTFNARILPAMMKARGKKFYMFGEVCTRGADVWYHDQPAISTCFYTWNKV